MSSREAQEMAINLDLVPEHTEGETSLISRENLEALLDLLIAADAWAGTEDRGNIGQSMQIVHDFHAALDACRRLGMKGWQSRRSGADEEV